MRLILIPIAINFSLAAFTVLLLLASAYNGLTTEADFTSFYVGWSIVHDGRGSSLYDLQTQREYEQRITQGNAPEFVEVKPYLNPPYLVLPFVPLALSSRVNAARIWLCIQFVFLICALRNLWSITAHWNSIERVYMLSAILGSFFIAYTMYQGAFSLLILLSMTYIYLAPRNSIKQGTWLIIASLKPQIILLPALMLIARRWWKALTGVTVLLIFLVCVSLPVLGWQSYLKYLALLKVVGGEFGPKYGAPPETMANFKGLITTSLGLARGKLINLLVYLALACAVVVGIYLWRTERNFNLRFALTILLGLFVAPHLNDQDVLVAALPTVLLYDHLRIEGKQKPLGIFLCILPGVLAIARTHDKRAVLILLILLLGWTALEFYRAPSQGLSRTT